MRKLNLNNNGLLSLADSTGSLSELVELNVRGNRLDTLPDSIADLKNLKILDIGSNKRLTLSVSLIVSLPSGCEVALQEIPLTEKVLSELESKMSSPDYCGPAIFWERTRNPEDASGKPFPTQGIQV